MSHSLQQRLARMLAAAILVAGVVAAMASFVLAYLEASEFQDETLRQIAVIGSRGTESVAATVVAASSDPESRVRLYHLPATTVPDWVTPNIGSGFHTLDSNDGTVRVFVRRDGDTRIIATQPTEARDELAINSALRTLVPSMLLVPLLLWMSARLLAREFNPINRLAQHVDAQSPDNPQGIEHTGVPAEIVPFIQAINRLLKRTAQLITQQRRFIADASHELRSPLAALSLQLQNLDQAGSYEELRARIAPLRAGVERARQLTTQLLDLARSQTDSDRAATTDLPVLVRELLAEFQPHTEARQIDLGLDEIESFALCAPPESVRLVLVNALDNAFKYTSPGSEVTVRVTRDGEHGLVEVIDQGPGIPHDQRERVFDAFYRLPGSRGIGSGLGLSIASEAATRSGGTIELHSGPSGIGLVLRYRCRVCQ
ncbi:MAG: two-component sensor histidine kinase [Chromatiaceae bacterium]|nr:two-component sensor histidine kinase [Chromatiaceae bacterium]